MRAKKAEGDHAGMTWTPPPPGRRWTEDDARVGLAAARASGESFARFARRHGVHESRLYWWMKQLRRKTAKPTTFLPVKVVEDRAPARQAEPAMVEIVVDRRVVRVGRGFDPMLLRAVLVALETAPC